MGYGRDKRFFIWKRADQGDVPSVQAYVSGIYRQDRSGIFGAAAVQCLSLLQKSYPDKGVSMKSKLFDHLPVLEDEQIRIRPVSYKDAEAER